MRPPASVVAGKGKVVELSELKGCVVTIDVHPELRGRVGKVDGDVVVSAAGGGRRDRRVKSTDAYAYTRTRDRDRPDFYRIFLSVWHVF